MRRQHRMERVTGRIGLMPSDSRDMMGSAVETLLSDGIRKVFFANRVNPEWSAETPDASLRFYRGKAEQNFGYLRGCEIVGS